LIEDIVKPRKNKEERLLSLR